jgi:hypothetical protein
LFPSQTAIAGSVDLRCYCLAESRRDGKISLVLPDFDFTSTWDIEWLPWDQVTPSAKAPRPESTPDQSLLDVLAQKFVKGAKPSIVQAEQAFLYLYMHLSEHKR